VGEPRPMKSVARFIPAQLAPLCFGKSLSGVGPRHKGLFALSNAVVMMPHHLEESRPRTRSIGTGSGRILHGTRLELGVVDSTGSRLTF
jgi:hypothetical protein